MFASECPQTRNKDIGIEKTNGNDFFLKYTCDICEFVCGRKMELDKHMKEKHDFKYPWKILGQASLKFRDWSPRILKGNGKKLPNEKSIPTESNLVHKPRMLKYFNKNRTGNKFDQMDEKVTGQGEESTLSVNLEENHISTPTRGGCLVRKGKLKDRIGKKKKVVSFKEEGSLCEITYFQRNSDHPFRGNKCKECDFICASGEVLEWHMNTHHEYQQFQNNLIGADLWETMKLIISLIVAVYITLYANQMLQMRNN